MLNTKTLLAHFGRDFPKHLAKKYHDYVGVMVGPLPRKISKVVVTLDLEYRHQATLASLQPDLVLTHHPFLYGSQTTLLKKDARKKAYVEWLKSHHIAVYSLHTNFDEGSGGMNDALAKALQLNNITPLINDPMARGGTLPQPMAIEAFASYARQALHVPYGFLIQAGKPIVSSVALVGGGGSRSYPIAQDEGYDVFISGDAPHHVRRSVVNDAYNYLELPHEIEEIFLPVMKNYLRSLDATLIVETPFVQTLPTLIYETK
jgi:dinuclear metal center YbgI/SA1388 family protein